ncbi:MAG: hypothetical protein HYY68_02660 [Thaumarchaeota archaeon]|nr:hypothetical protein [Nitrososphaerota archaeon]MBI3022612.1 hypothetical protein [Nitrososphaerota archaeon]
MREIFPDSLEDIGVAMFAVGFWLALISVLLGLVVDYTDIRVKLFTIGIVVEGENRWLTLIQNASRVARVDSTKKSEGVPRI